MLQSLYRGLTEYGGPAIRYYLARRRALGKEDPTRQGERFGVSSRPRPNGPLVWCHAASVGEAVSILVLIDRVLAQAPHVGVLVTTGTVTSAKVMASRLPARAFHQYFPVDRPAYVRSFLSHWRPDLVLWTESELWPNMLWEIADRGFPTALINARISERSFARWQRVPDFVTSMLRGFSLCLTQTETDAVRLKALGATFVRPVGNLKFAAAPLPVDQDDLLCTQHLIDGRPVWLMASTHRGEDELAADVHERLRAQFPDLLTVIAPRHPERGPSILDRLSGRGLSVALRSRGQAVDASTDIYVGDTMGELGLFYRLVRVVAVGGSFVPRGGQNPIEPAQLGCAVLYGPHMHNFATVTRELEQAGAALALTDRAALGDAVARLLQDEASRHRLGEAARAVTARNRSVVDRTMDALAPLLRRAGIVVTA